MYTPTKWESFKNIVRYILCRHKHTEIRTVKFGSGSDLKEIGRYKYCIDCKNNMTGWL